MVPPPVPRAGSRATSSPADPRSKPTSLPPPPPTSTTNPPGNRAPTVAALSGRAQPSSPPAGPAQRDSQDGTFDAMATYPSNPAPKPTALPPPTFTKPKPPTAPPPTPAAAAAAASLPPRKPIVPSSAKKPAFALPAIATPRPPGVTAAPRIVTDDVSIDTDVAAPEIDAAPRAPASFESSGPTHQDNSFDTATIESTSFTGAPTPPAGENPTLSDDNAATSAVEKLSPAEITAPDLPPAPPTDDAPAAAATSHPKVPISTAPDSLPAPTAQETATSGPSPACPQCEAPMAWVEAHLRFYCKSCKMYF